MTTDSNPIRALVRRADDLVKAAPNRADATQAWDRAASLLDEAERRLQDLPPGEERDGLVVMIGLRRDDINRLVRLAADPRRSTLDEPVAPDPMPQPGHETLGRTRERLAERTPPNQRLVTSWPVLHVGTPPRVDLDTWRLPLTGLVESATRLTWSDLRGLPATTLTSDFHCVTGWSRLDNRWEGVRFRDVAAVAGVRPQATHALVFGANAYSANLDLDTLMGDEVLFAWSHDGAELESVHGGPLRLVVPSRYAWKSVKWVESVKFLDRDVAGYWEMRGYHNVADPWLEQRYG